jgi:hypothetical protein
MQLGPAGLSLRVARSPVEVWPAGAAHRCVGGTHTRVADGRLLCWSPEDLPGVPPADVATTTVDDLIVSFGVGARSPTS